MIQNIQMPPAATAVPWPVLWAPVFSAAGVVLVGCVAAYIAYRQMVTARTKVQLDLYALRMPFYRAVNQVIYATLAQRFEDPAWEEMISRQAESRYIFDPSLADYLDNISRACQRIRVLKGGVRALGKPLSQAEQDWVEATADWLIEQQDLIPQVFGPWLILEARKNHIGRKVRIKPLPLKQ